MQKLIEVEGIGEVILAKRKGTRNIRISISGDKVRLGMPFGVSEAAALQFLNSRRDWILKHKKDEAGVLKSGDQIGKSHKLFFEPFEVIKPTARLHGQTIVVKFPRKLKSYMNEVQEAATRGSKKALQKEAEKYLLPRLKAWSDKTELDYKIGDVKFMKSRWGHCSNRGEITLNSYLVQYDWKLIDYVIVHELAHTAHHDHSDKFWSLVAKHCPPHKTLRKELKNKQTAVVANATESPKL